MRRTPRLSFTAERIQPAVFAELQGRIDRMMAEGKELVMLQIGDTCLSPPAATRAMVAALDGKDDALFRYGATSGLPQLREALARILGARGMIVDARTDVLVGNGATHALFCAARATLDPGDEVLLASPYWPLAPGIFSACGAVNVEVPLTQCLYEDPSFDVEAAFVSRLTPRTKAIYFISPNNPDGKVLGRRELDAIARVAREHDLWVFADEVYAEAIFDAADGAHVSIATLPEMAERTIVAQSLSKSHALSGCRVGFVVGPAPVIASARRVAVHTAFNVPVAMQRLALSALADARFAREACAVYRSARDAAVRALEGSGIGFHVPDGATYLFLDFRPILARTGHSMLSLLERAVDRGVLLAPGQAFGRGFESFARLCFTSVPEAQVLEGIARLREAIEIS